MIQPKPSKIFLVLLLFIFAMSFMCLWSCSVYYSLKITISLLIILYAIQIYLRFFTHCFKTNVISFSHQGKRDWQLQLASGETIPALLQNNSLLTRYLIILNFKSPSYKRLFSIPLFLDSQSAKILKSLRITLLNNK